MNFIISILTGPIFDFLKSIIGPLAGLLGGMKLANDANKIKNLGAENDAHRKIEAAGAEAPKTEQEVIDLLKNLDKPV